MFQLILRELKHLELREIVERGMDFIDNEPQFFRHATQYKSDVTYSCGKKEKEHSKNKESKRKEKNLKKKLETKRNER